MMYIVSDYQLKLQNEVEPWLFYNPETESLELRSDAPKEIQSKYKKLQDCLNKNFCYLW